MTPHEKSAEMFAAGVRALLLAASRIMHALDSGPDLTAPALQLELAEASSDVIRGSMRLHQAVEAFSADARMRAQA